MATPQGLRIIYSFVMWSTYISFKSLNPRAQFFPYRVDLYTSDPIVNNVFIAVAAHVYFVVYNDHTNLYLNGLVEVAKSRPSTLGGYSLQHGAAVCRQKWSHPHLRHH